MKLTPIHLVVIASLSACASRPSDWGLQSRRLQQGMSEAQAIAAIGRGPDSTEVLTCGEEKGTGWECRRLTFRSSGADSLHTLVVYEANQVGTWRVDSWNAL